MLIAAVVGGLLFDISTASRTYADISKAKEQLQYNPLTPIKEGISKYVQRADQHVI